MKTKNKFSLIFIVGILLYGLSFIATSKQQEPSPCQIALSDRLNSDTSISNHISRLGEYRDTLIFNGDTTRPGNWDKITDTICSVYKRNCTYVTTILIVNNRDTARVNWDTRFGKKIFFKACP